MSYHTAENHPSDNCYGVTQVEVGGTNGIEKSHLINVVDVGRVSTLDPAHAVHTTPDFDVTMPVAVGEASNLAAHVDYDTQLSNAAKLYLDRQARRDHPDGYSTNGDKWYPSEDERCWCCKFVREPSWKWPWSLNKHCRSIEHVAALMDVDATDLRRAVRGLKAKAGVA